MGVSVLAIKDFLMGWFNLIPKLMYFLCVTCMSVIDAMQLLVRKLAGLDVYYVDGVAQEGDIAISFIKSIFTENSSYPAIKNAFWALVVFGFILLIVTTIISVIRQEYMPGGDNAKAGIVNNFFKSIFLFLIVPVSCIFGIMILDVVLVAVDGVLNNSVLTTSGVVSEITNLDSKLKSEPSTNGKQTYVYYDIFGSPTPCTSTTFSGTMFKTVAYSANRVRLNDVYDENTFAQGLFNGSISNFGLFTLSDRESNAELIDIAFASNFYLKNPVQVELGFMEETCSSGPFWKLKNGDTIENFSKYNVRLVYYFYDLWQFNFLIGFAFFVITIKIFSNLIFGLFKRTIEMVGLFIVSPPIIAIMPLDGGKAFGKWREGFMSKALSAVASIVGLNVVMIVLPYLNSIALFEFKILNLIISSLFIIVGLSVIETFLAMVSKMVGAEDVNKVGSETVGKVGDLVSKSALLTASVAGTALKFTPAGAAASAAARKATAGVKAGAKAIGKKLSENEKFKNLQAKIFTSKKQKNDALAQAESDFYNGDAEREFEQEIDNDEQYQNEIDIAWNDYKSHWKSNKTKEEWLQTNQIAQNIRQKAVLRKTGGMDRSKYILSQKSNFIQKRQNEILQKLGAQQSKGIIKQKLGNAVKFAGINNAAAFGSLFYGNIKSSLVRGGKGGFKSMFMAFNAKNLKKIEENAKLAELQKEEIAKFTAQQKEREKSNKK